MVLIKYSGKYVKIYFSMKITFLDLFVLFIYVIVYLFIYLYTVYIYIYIFFM